MTEKELSDFADILIDEANFIKREIFNHRKIDESVIHTYKQVEDLLR